MAADLASRVVRPEILDSLPAGDPDAVCSRNDLRRLDGFLGGSRWIVSAVRAHRAAAEAGIVELGAGDGRLCSALALESGGCRITGLDLAPPPTGLDRGVHWRSGNFFQTLPGTTGSIAVGNLILHHFEPPALRVLGEMLRPFRGLIFSEPLRHPLPLLLSWFAGPFVGAVTRHDMPASIRAGFVPGEIAVQLGLDAKVWRISESSRLRGVVRFMAWRD